MNERGYSHIAETCKVPLTEESASAEELTCRRARLLGRDRTRGGGECNVVRRIHDRRMEMSKSGATRRVVPASTTD